MMMFFKSNRVISTYVFRQHQ